MTATSPFAVPLGSLDDALPPPFREQLLVPADASWRVLLEGRMERVWHRPRWLRPILRLLARWAVLFPETGKDVPTRMLIVPGFDARGRPLHIWRRTFLFSTERRIDAEIVHEPTRNQIVEWMGPGKSLEMAWHASFFPPRELEIRAELQAIRIRRLRLPLPRALRVTARAIDKAGPADDELRCDLVVSHPLLGPVFGYSGRFRVARVEGSRER